MVCNSLNSTILGWPSPSVSSSFRLEFGIPILIDGSFPCQFLLPAHQAFKISVMYQLLLITNLNSGFICFNLAWAIGRIAGNETELNNLFTHLGILKPLLDKVVTSDAFI